MTNFSIPGTKLAAEMYLQKQEIFSRKVNTKNSERITKCISEVYNICDTVSHKYDKFRLLPRTRHIIIAHVI